MATKFLGRTIVERGRPAGNIFERHYSHRQTRAALRRWFATLDDEGYEPWHRPVPVTEYVERNLTDKLGPVHRWLDHQTGRSWDDVYSEICSRFPWNTLTGLHIIRSHVFPEVFTSSGRPDPDFLIRNYFVDDQGIFRKVPRKPRRSGPSWAKENDRKAAKQWLNGRRVSQVGSQYYWYELTYSRTPCACRFCRTSYAEWKHNSAWWDGKHWLATQPGAHDYYRQAERLTSNEVATFLAFHPDIQNEILTIKPPIAAAV